MKVRIIAIYAVILSLAYLGCQTSKRISIKDEQRSPIHLQLNINKKYYDRNDEIILYIIVMNVSNNPIFLDGRMFEFAHIYLKIYDNRNREIKFSEIRAFLMPPKREEYYLLRPGHFIGLKYVKKIEDLNIKKTGYYKIEVHFQAWEDGNEYGLDAWTGNIFQKIKIIVL